MGARRSLVAFSTSALIASLALAGWSSPAAGSSPTACRVSNVETGIVRRSLQAAVSAASPGDRLTVRGTCRGSTVIGKALRIRGIETATSGPPTLDGRDRGRVLLVQRGADVVIRGLTVRRGDGGPFDNGGGILARGRVTLRDVTVRGNVAANGGGVSVGRRGSLRLTGSTAIRNNRVYQYGGGGIGNGGAVTMQGRSTVRGNEADFGGGVFNALRGELTMRGSSSIRDNRAMWGGGIYNYGSVRMFDASSVRGNVATEAGGGLYVEQGSLLNVSCWPPDVGNVYSNTPDDCVP
jgi:nitrous oxidase accessory protein NosD